MPRRPERGKQQYGRPAHGDEAIDTRIPTVGTIKDFQRDPRRNFSPQDTTGLPEKQRYPPPRERGADSQSDEPQRVLIRREGNHENSFRRHSDDSENFSRFNNGSRPREGGQISQPLGQRRSQGPNLRSDRGALSSQDRATRSGPRRPRASRGNGDGAPSRRKRGRRDEGGGGPMGRRRDISVWSEEEKDYFKQKRESEEVKTVDAQTRQITRQTFQSDRPAVVSGQSGISNFLGETLMLAKKYLEGSFIIWPSKEQKADVMTLIDKLKRMDGGTVSEQSSEASSIKPEQSTESLLQKLVGGSYNFAGPEQSKDAFSHANRQTDKNQSYSVLDQKPLLEQVRRLVPFHDGQKYVRGVKATAKT